MPLIRIETRRHRRAADVQALIDAVHAAQCATLKVPASDRHIRYIEHTPEHFLAPPGRSENYTLIEITLYSGLSPDSKRALYQTIVHNLGGLGISASDIFIVLNEQPLDNWGVRGGVPASEIDLGIAVKI